MDNVKVVSVEDVFPAQENLRNGAYPLTHFLYILTLPSPEPTVEAYVEFLQSPAGQEIIAAHGLGRIN